MAELRAHALVIGKVTLSSGLEAEYYVDAKRAILRPAGFLALGELVAGGRRRGASAVGGLTMGADPVACAALAAGADVKAFFVRKDRKAHGLQRWVEGPPLDPGERCLIVEDVVTTGGSTVQAIERVREEGLEIVGVVSVLDRLAGGGAAIEAAAGAPYWRSRRSTSSTRTVPTDNEWMHTRALREGPVRRMPEPSEGGPGDGVPRGGAGEDGCGRGHGGRAPDGLRRLCPELDSNQRPSP